MFINVSLLKLLSALKGLDDQNRQPGVSTLNGEDLRQVKKLLIRALGSKGLMTKGTIPTVIITVSAAFNESVGNRPIFHFTRKFAKYKVVLQWSPDLTNSVLTNHPGLANRMTSKVFFTS